MAKYCTNCGKQLRDIDRFCSVCGTPVKETEPSAPTQSFSQPKNQTEKKKRKIPDFGLSGLEKILLVVLAAELAVCLLWHPGFLIPKGNNSTGKIVNTGYEGDDEWPYHSKALDIAPIDGFHITAEEGALYDNTVFNVTTLDETSDIIAEADEQLQESGAFVLAAFEVDAGLEDGVSLPGEYQVEIDLEKYGIPESLFENLAVCRIDESGDIEILDHEISGKQLKYSSYKNSPILILGTPLWEIIAGGVIVVIGLVCLSNKGNEAKYKFFPENSPCILGDTKNGKYSLRWNMAYMDPEQQKVIDELAQLHSAMKKQAQDEYEENSSWYDVGRYFNKNTLVAERVQKLSAGNKDYQKLLKQLRIPDNVTIIKNHIDTAFKYLGDRCMIKMPKHRVEFLVKDKDPDNDKNLGTATQPTFSKSYIDLYVKDTKLLTDGSAAGIDTKDDLLLTITHELFHICQERYHTTLLTDSNRFDEMVTLVLESDAKEYYRLYDIITSDPKLTNTNFGETMILPIDDDLPLGPLVQHVKENWNSLEKINDNLQFRNLFLQNQGYFLSSFVQFLRQETGKDVTPRQIMVARSYWTKPNTSGPLKKAFDLSDAMFDIYFRKFIMENSEKICSDFETANSSAWFRAVYTLKDIQLEKGKPVHFDFDGDGSFSIKYRNFILPNNEPTVVLVQLDSTAADDHPEVNLLSSYGSEKTSFGMRPKIPPKNKNVALLECYGDLSEKRTKKTGYTVWPVTAPDKPELSYDKDNLKVKLPAPVGAAKEAALIDGLIIYVTNEDGKTKEFYVSPEDFGKEMKVPLFEVKPKDKDSYSLTVTIKEYYLTNKLDYLYMPESEPAKIDITGEEVIYAGLKLYRDSLSGFTFQDPNNEDHEGRVYEYDPLPSDNTIRINGDKVTVQFGNLNYKFHGHDADYPKAGSTTFDKRESFTVTGRIVQKYGEDIVVCEVTEVKPGTIQASASESGAEAVLNNDGTVNRYIHADGQATYSITNIDMEYDEEKESPSRITLYYEDGKFTDASVTLKGTISYSLEGNYDGEAVSESSTEESYVTYTLINE